MLINSKLEYYPIRYDLTPFTLSEALRASAVARAAAGHTTYKEGHMILNNFKSLLDIYVYILK